jgi:hypothetical protein|nr:MAG TPA: hypothetical protein [Caudoviricetes sp.]
MKIRNVDANWDWTFGQSTTNYVNKLYAVALDNKMKLLEFTNDCFFALQNGIPWLTRLGMKNQKDLLDRDILNIAQSVEGTLNITDFQSTVTDRYYTCSYNVYSIYSTDAQPINFDTRNFLNA